MPVLADYRRLIGAWGWVMVGIVGTFAGFGVLNTMLMAVFERTHELLHLAGPSPLLALVGTALINVGDASALLLPHGEWGSRVGLWAP